MHGWHYVIMQRSLYLSLMIQVSNAQIKQRDTSASVRVVGLEKIAKVSFI